MTIIVTDPCKDTQISSIGLPDSFSVPEGDTSSELTVTGPTNSISTLYGNGYDSCGPLSYQVLELETGLIVSSDHFSLKTVSDLVNGDRLTLHIEDSSPDGPIITKKLVIKAFLSQVPSASPLFVPIDVSYRECRVD